MESSKMNELFYKHVSKWPRYLLTMVILLFPLKIPKEGKKKLECLLLDFNRVGCLIFLFTTMCRENG